MVKKGLKTDVFVALTILVFGTSLFVIVSHFLLPQHKIVAISTRDAINPRKVKAMANAEDHGRMRVLLYVHDLCSDFNTVKWWKDQWRVLLSQMSPHPHVMIFAATVFPIAGSGFEEILTSHQREVFPIFLSKLVTLSNLDQELIVSSSCIEPSTDFVRTAMKLLSVVGRDAGVPPFDVAGCTVFSSRTGEIEDAGYTYRREYFRATSRLLQPVTKVGIFQSSITSHSPMRHSYFVTSKVDAVGPHCMLVRSQCFNKKSFQQMGTRHVDCSAYWNGTNALLLQPGPQNPDHGERAALAENEVVKSLFDTIANLMNKYHAIIPDISSKCKFRPSDSDQMIVESIVEDATFALNTRDKAADVAAVLELLRKDHTKGRRLPRSPSSLAIEKVQATAREYLEKVAQRMDQYLIQLHQGLWPEVVFFSTVAELSRVVVFDELAVHGKTLPAGMTLSNPIYSDRLEGGTPPSFAIMWATVCCGCCGFSAEMESLMFPLEHALAIITNVGPSCFCHLPRGKEMSLRRMAVAPGSTFLKEVDSVIWISHTDPTQYDSLMWPDVPVKYFIGRSMYELTLISDSWVEKMNSASVNEVWVPSTFVQNVFQSCGVHPEKLVVVPEAVDVELWRGRKENEARTDLVSELRQFGSNATLFDSCPSMNYSDAPFVFLSQFKWEPRKGWDILFQVFRDTFGQQRGGREVVLVVLARFWFANVPPKDGNRIKYVVEELRQHFHDTPLDAFPHFLLFSGDVAQETLAKWYRNSDCFVLPTRGEGWGLPVLQAMASEVSVIVTNYSGPTDFVTEDTGLLLKIDDVVEVPRNSIYRYQKGKKWAQPSASHLALLMQQVVEEQEGSTTMRVRNARREVVEKFSERSVASRILGEIARISSRLHL